MKDPHFPEQKNNGPRRIWGAEREKWRESWERNASNFQQHKHQENSTSCKILNCLRSFICYFYKEPPVRKQHFETGYLKSVGNLLHLVTIQIQKTFSEISIDERCRRFRLTLSIESPPASNSSREGENVSNFFKKILTRPNAQTWHDNQHPISIAGSIFWHTKDTRRVQFCQRFEWPWPICSEVQPWSCRNQERAE